MKMQDETDAEPKGVGVARSRGPSQLNERHDAKWERVKAEIKAELMPKDRKKEKST